VESPPRGFLFLVGLKAHFCLRGAAGASGGGAIVTGTLRERLIALIEPLLQRLGYELVELEYSAGRAHAVLRLFIDRDAGVTLDDDREQVTVSFAEIGKARLAS